MNLNRRQMLVRSAGASLIALLGTAKNVFAGPEEVASAIKEFAGGAEVGSGKLTLVAPEIAENGNSVPIAVSVESPMTADDYVESVVIYADGNPRPGVITFNQNVVAVAKMSDGSVVSDTRNVKVTIGGCGG